MRFISACSTYGAETIARPSPLRHEFSNLALLAEAEVDQLANPAGDLIKLILYGIARGK